MDWQKDIIEEAVNICEDILTKEIINFSWKNYKFNYRKEHIELVLSIGMELNEELKGDKEIIKAAIILHDIGRKKRKKGHARLGAEMAEEILKNSDFPEEKIDAVKYAIASHAGWDESVPETLEACILWDADKLSKLGATIVLHKAMVLPFKGKNSFDSIHVFNRWLKSAEFIKDNMKTEPGKKMALERFKTLKFFVESLNKEMISVDKENYGKLGTIKKGSKR